MRSATQWLIEIGEQLWSIDEFKPEKLIPWVQNRELFLAYLNGSIIGTMLLLWEDPTIWPDKPPNEALYVHKLCVRRDHAGQGVSDAMLQFAMEAVVKSDRQYLRIDCDERPKLCALYERLGFIRHSTFRVGSLDTIRYQINVLNPSNA